MSDDTTVSRRLAPGSRVADTLRDDYQISLLVEEVLEDVQTGFQHIQIVRTAYFGKALLLDGIIQLTERDNAAYHEMITHPAILAKGDARRVLIVGGGDGGTLQQVLKHSSVEQAVVCELDRGVVELCEKHFPAFEKPFQNPRSQLVIEDAFDYLQRPDSKFDVIMADTTDPIGEAEKLFSPEFYRLMANALTPGGVVVTQCEQMYFNTDLIQEMVGIGRSLKKHAGYFYTLVPTYPGGSIGFLYMSDTHWSEGFGRAYPEGLQYFNAGVHQAAFALPEFLKQALGE